MRKTAHSTTAARRVLSRRLEALRSLASGGVPRAGWLKAIREALGITAQQLAARLKVAQATVRGMEKSEQRGAISLKTLQRAAREMGCTVVYAIVPSTGTLDEIVSKQAHLAASRALRRVSHSMALEGQRPPSDVEKRQVEELAQELVRQSISRIWDEP